MIVSVDVVVTIITVPVIVIALMRGRHTGRQGRGQEYDGMGEHGRQGHDGAGG